MNSVTFFTIALALLVFGLISRRLRDSVITPPMAFIAFGFVLGSAVLDVVKLDINDGHLIHVFAEITLILVLFTDAARINLRELRRDHDLPVRMLVIGMPLTIAAGTGLALLLFPVMSIWAAALLAAMLAPTDAALGQSVVTSPKVPGRIRQAVNVESGLNDGIALPIILLFLCGASAAHSTQGWDYWLVFGAKQLVFGPLAGILVGYLGAKAIDAAMTRGWMTESFQPIFPKWISDFAVLTVVFHL